MNLTYYTTTKIHLSLEDFHNAGMTPDQTKACIEGIINPFQGGCYSSGDRLRCFRSGINNNWPVEVSPSSQSNIAYVVGLIEDALLRGLR